MTEIEINQPYETVFESTIEILTANEFDIKESNQEERFIIATKGVSFLSYGESIEINFKRNRNSTKVSIHSYSKGIQVIDWGTNKENEKLISSELKKI